MADTNFDLSFSGALAAGADPTAARQHLMRAFKLDETGVARLFCGQSVVIKRNVDAKLVDQYRQVFAQAGAILEVRPAGDGANAAAAGSATVPAAVPPSAPPAAATAAPEPAAAPSFASAAADTASAKSGTGSGTAAAPPVSPSPVAGSAAASDSSRAAKGTDAPDTDDAYTDVPPKFRGIAAPRIADDANLSLAAQDGGFLEALAPIDGPTPDIGHLNLVGGANWRLDDCAVPVVPAPIPDIGHLALVDSEPAAGRRRDENPFDDD